MYDAENKYNYEKYGFVLFDDEMIATIESGKILEVFIYNQSNLSLEKICQKEIIKSVKSLQKKTKLLELKY